MKPKANHSKSKFDNSESEEDMKLWKSQAIKVKKDLVYKFGFELTIPDSDDLCYFSPFDEKE
jgi:hypothetical protein